MMRRQNSTTTDEVNHILLVEDEPSAREASQRYLSHCGYEVTAVATAEEALTRASQTAPDIAVCDWRLGGGRDGVEVARELQRRFGIPIIFMTAHPLDELRDAASDVHIQGILRKPISLATLAQTIAAVAT